MLYQESITPDYIMEFDCDQILGFDSTKRAPSYYTLDDAATSHFILVRPPRMTAFQATD